MAVVPQVGKCQLVSIIHEPPSPPLPVIAGVVFGVIPQQSLLSDVPIFGLVVMVTSKNVKCSLMIAKQS